MTAEEWDEELNHRQVRIDELEDQVEELKAKIKAVEGALEYGWEDDKHGVRVVEVEDIRKAIGSSSPSSDQASPSGRQPNNTNIPEEFKAWVGTPEGTKSFTLRELNEMSREQWLGLRSGDRDGL